MKKSVIIPVVLSLIFLAANLYAQSNTDAQDNAMLLVSKKLTLPKVNSSTNVNFETEKIVEFTLEDFEEVSPYKIVVYDIQGNEVFTLSSESKIAFDKVPKSAKLLMEDGKTTFYIVDKKEDILEN